MDDHELGRNDVVAGIRRDGNVLRDVAECGCLSPFRNMSQLRVFLGPDVATGREDVSVRGLFGGGGR